MNSTYKPAAGLHASVQVHGVKWKELYSAEAAVNAGRTASQRVFSIPDKLYAGAERIFFIDLSLTDSAGNAVSRNFYWVPGTLTTFDWEATTYTHTPAERNEDLAALAHLPPAQVHATSEIVRTAQGREVRLHLDNASQQFAFQITAAARTSSGGLIAPVFWSDNWIELLPGESTTLTAELPDDAPETPTIHVDGWNIAPITLTPVAASAEKTD